MISAVCLDICFQADATSDGEKRILTRLKLRAVNDNNPAITPGRSSSSDHRLLAYQHIHPTRPLTRSQRGSDATETPLAFQYADSDESSFLHRATRSHRHTHTGTPQTICYFGANTSSIFITGEIRITQNGQILRHELF